MEGAAVLLRVKRKRGGPVPAEALVLACKRLRTEEEAAAAAQDGVEKNLFKLVATVASENEPIQKYVQEAFAKGKAAQLLRPSLGSAQRVMQSLRSSKQANRQESRYRLVASHRPNLTDGEKVVLDASGVESGENSQLVSEAKKDVSQKESHDTSDYCGEFQLLDIVQEEDVEKDTAVHLKKPDDPDVILCNAVEMIRQRLTVSGSSKEAECSTKGKEYVYDIYCIETAPPGWIENILSVQPYTQECELVDGDHISEEIYDEDDDENNENNWRNDYPDEDEVFSEEESESGSISDEDSGYIRRTWSKYQSDVLQEFEYDELQELDSE